MIGRSTRVALRFDVDVLDPVEYKGHVLGLVKDGQAVSERDDHRIPAIRSLSQTSAKRRSGACRVIGD